MEVTITNNSKIKQGIPLDVILGDSLSYGTLDIYGRLKPNETSEYGFTAYLKDRIARGITLDWKPDNAEFITLKLFTPTAEEEIDAFYAMVGRICAFWDAAMMVDGVVMELTDFFSGMRSLKHFNRERSDAIFNSFFTGERTKYTIQCVMFPLSIGKEEAMRFRGHHDVFVNWLHDKQKMDIYYAAASYYRGRDSIHGRYVLTEGVVSIFPSKPFVPRGLIDPQTHRPLKCDYFLTAFYSPNSKNIIGVCEYDNFIRRVPKDKMIYFDCDHVVIFALTFDEILNIIEPPIAKD